MSNDNATPAPEEKPKIVSLRGEPIPQLGKPNAKCVELLETWLEKAKAGDIVGAYVIALYSDDYAGYGCGGVIERYTLLGVMAQAQYDLHGLNVPDDEDEDDDKGPKRA